MYRTVILAIPSMQPMQPIQKLSLSRWNQGLSQLFMARGPNFARGIIQCMITWHCCCNGTQPPKASISWLWMPLALAEGSSPQILCLVLLSMSLCRLPANSHSFVLLFSHTRCYANWGIFYGNSIQSGLHFGLSITARLNTLWNGFISL